MKSVTNVTRVARDIIHEIGAVSDNPPERWKKIVESRLEELGVDVKKVNLYAIRSKELAKGSQEPVPLDEDYRKTLLEVSALARRLGGIDKLMERVKLIESLKV